jgi:hypothetical protein
MTAGIIGCLFLIPAYLAFDKQECKVNYYGVGDYECRNCFDYHGDECTACLDATTCTECVQGHYLNTTDSLCYLCKDTWRGCVDCIYNQPPTLQEKEQEALNTIELNKGMRAL